MNPFAAALLAGVRAAGAVSGVTIRYRRGDASTLIERVLLGKALDVADTENTNSPRIEHSDRDFLIRPETIVLDGQQTAPVEFDQIEILDESHPSYGLVWEVLPTPGGRPYACMGNFETLFRVFTRQVTT